MRDEGERTMGGDGNDEISEEKGRLWKRTREGGGGESSLDLVT